MIISKLETERNETIMAKLSFAGGVHLANKKTLTYDKSIRLLKAGAEVVYPLMQHYGEPAQPIVQVGDRVLVGQKIAESAGEVSASIYASVSGTVSALEERSLITGKKVLSLVVENDTQMESVSYAPVKPLSEMSNQDILDAIKNAGVVEAGNSGMPIHVKCNHATPEKVDYVILNAVQSETYGTAEMRLLLEETDKVMKALRIVLRLFENARGVIALDDETPHPLLRRIANMVKDDARISLKKVDSKYPQSADQQLIYAITERKLSKRKVATEHKCILLNVETMLAIYHAVIEGRPLTERVLTVSGEMSKGPGNYRVPLGTLYKDVIKQTGGFQEKSTLICGDTMTGLKTNNFKAPVTKISAGITGIQTEEKTQFCEGNCIRCGRCVEVCPARLIPTKLCDAAEQKDKEAFAVYSGHECSECGCCSYVCPTGRELTQTISAMHKGIAQKKRSPHIHAGNTVLGMVFAAILAMMPVLGTSIAKYGLGALWTVLVSIGTALVAEVGYDIYKKKFLVFDMTTLAFGFLLGLSLPVGMPLWLVALGALLMVVLYRILNPLMGKVSLNPVAASLLVLSIVGIFVLHGQHWVMASSSLIAPLIGACIMILAGVTDLRIPGYFLCTFSVILLVFGGVGIDFTYLTTQLTLSGAAFFAFFLLPEYQSRPCTILGQSVFGLTAGLLAGLLWVLKLGMIAIPVSIVLVNLLSSTIEKYTIPLPFGQKSKSVPEKSIIKKIETSGGEQQ